MRRKSYAKSVVAVAMAATVALSATACGSKSTADTADTSTSQSEAASSETETPTATPAPTTTPAPTATPAPAESAAESTDSKSEQGNTDNGGSSSGSQSGNANSGKNNSGSNKGSQSGKTTNTAKAPAQAAAPAPTATPKPITYTYVVRKHPASCTTAGYDEHICQEWGGMNYNDNYVAPNGHDWGTGVVTKQATYYEKGAITYTCKNCGETRTEETPELDKTYHIKEVVAPTCTSEGYTIYECNEVPGLTYKGEYTAKLPHSWDGGVVTKAATIYEKGVKTFTCTVCGETRTEDIKVLDKTWHKGQTVAPTCTEQGYTVYICDQDKNLTEKRDYTAALGHDYDNGVVTTPATCTTEGVMTYTCTRDGATKTETIPALGHKWDDGTITTAPTCETEGEKTYKCTNDGCTETKTEAVAALGHDWDNGTVTTPATCTAEGVLTYTCKRDASHSKTEAIPALGHKWDDGTITTAPTCEAEGVKTYKCTNDGCTETKTESVAALGHDWDDGVVTTPATCEADGVKTFTCKNDGSHTKTESIPALGHDWNDGEVTTPATCETDGVKTYTCKNDASHTKTETIAKLGHKWDAGKVTKEPTYDSDGIMTFTCQNDPTHTYTETIPAKKYTFTVTVVDPTCTEQGYTLHTCNQNAEKSYKDNYTDALGHDYKGVITPATCKDAGKVENVCQRCNDTQLVKELPVTEDHQWNDGVVTKAATCTEAGEKLYTCTVCNKTKAETIEATGHDWNETTTPATCGKAGSVDRTCKTCGTTEHVKDLPATGNHAWDAGKITTEATCDGKGVKTFTCTVCNETKTEEIAALGHDFAYGYCSRCDLNANYNQKEWEQDIFEQTNGLRTKYNLSTLTYRDDLQYAADIRVEELVQNYITYGDYGGKWGNPHVRPDGSGAATALGDKQDLACGENAANDAGIFGKGHMFYLWTQSEGHLAAIMNPDADGMVCALKEYNGRVFGIQIFVRDPDYTTTSTQSVTSNTSTPVEIAAVVVTDSATTETAAN